MTAHRLSTLDETLAWLREAQVVTEAGAVDGVPSFVEAVVGSKVQGSWWGHPQGRRIFNLGEAVADSGEVLMLKLLDGKRTWVHRESWPLVLRVVLDRAWVEDRVGRLNASAKGLFRHIEKTGKVKAPPAAATSALEKLLLVHVASEHTASGNHVKQATAWKSWAKSTHAKQADLDVSVAQANLRRLAAGHFTALD